MRVDAVASDAVTRSASCTNLILSNSRYDRVDRVLYLTPAIPGDFRAFLATDGGFGTVGVRNGEPFLEVRAGEIPVEEIRYHAASATR